MNQQIKLGDLVVDVVKKDIKNIHLSVNPPEGKVRVSSPLRMNLDNIRVFTVSKLGWIKKQQKKIREQAREAPREYLDRESHYLWGKRYLLDVIEVDAAPQVTLTHSKIKLQVRPRTTKKQKNEVLELWYRDQVREAVLQLIKKWEPKLGVKVAKFFVQRMKTKWGSCNHKSGNIRLNTDLAKKPRECLEYIVLHEMVHLLEPTHNEQFITLMNNHMPKWQFYKEELNRLPVRHERWTY